MSTEEEPVPEKASELSGVDLARVALRAARKAAEARGNSAKRGQVQRGNGVRSGAHADRRDPMALGPAINRLITEHGWEAPAAVGGVRGRWPQIVGEKLADHCIPMEYDEDERILVVKCESPVWATEVRRLAAVFVARLNEDLGHGTVKVIKVLNPNGPPRRYGPLRAPGSTEPGKYL